MNYFLIDFENVRSDGIKTIAQIKAEDTVIIFYSEQCKSIALDVIEEITKNNVKLKCFKVTIGAKNALDFQLSSYLGYLIGNESGEAKYYIVSNDKGYDCLCDYWKNAEKNVERISIPETIKESVDVQSEKPQAAKKKKSKVQPNDMATLADLKKILAEEDKPEEVLAIFNQYKTKQAICNGLAKAFKDSKKAGVVYKKLKPLLKEKKKT